MNELANHLGKQLSFYVFLFVTTLFSISYSYADIPIPSQYPANGNIYPWGFQTKGTTWNTSSFLPFIYNKLPFRMMLPPGVTYNSTTNTFTNNSGKTFPVLLFLHGLGEVGTENGYQLRHGARNFMNAMNAGDYEGILLFPQNFTEFWGPGQQDILIGLLNQLINKGLADPYRTCVNGLSSGGHGVWTTTYFNPKYIASAVPMSAANVTTIPQIPEFIHIPIWESQGGKDTRPPPGTAQALIDAIVDAGGNARLSFYPDLGHGTWDRMFTEPDFFPFFMRANKVNPHVFFNRREFCAGDPVNIKLGVTPGFEGYEWRKDGAIMSGANGNEINVATYGTYDCRIKRNGVWSYWSPIPVVVKIKDPTITPPIQTLGLATNVIPDPNGSSSVSLSLPDGYEEYLWRKVGSSLTIGTENVLVTSSAGDYIASVKELYGCSSNFSSPFTIVNNVGGSGSPPAPINFTGFSLSQTQVQLDWGQNPNPANNESAFEIYRSLTTGGPYTLIKKTVSDAASFVDSGLAEDTDYFYIIRAVNSLGGSSVSPQINVKTQVDAQPPSTPLQLVATETTASSVTLGWQPSTDNVGVYRYEVYRNGVKVFISETTSATIYNLNEHESYNFYVKARDLAGNFSPASEQITATPIQNGLNYKYYEGSWTVLPDFNSLSPVKTGVSSTVDRGPRNRDTNYGFYWEGKINIPVAGNYTFETNSDDGSKLYIGGYGSQYEVVDNDGSHGGRYREGTYNFPAPGRYTIVVTYFQISGSQGMYIYWKNTASGINSRQQIPTSAFNDNFVIPVNPPNEPSGLSASAISYNNIALSWTDNSNNENGFQIYRSSTNQGTFVPVGLVGANVTAFNDLTVTPNTKYYYKIKAVGQNGESDFNTGVARGLDYRYRRQDFTSLSQLESATIDKEGNSANFDLSPRTSSTYYGFLWDGLIYVPQTGLYTFWTRSDDGSRLYIDNELVVDNDLNGNTERNNLIPLNLTQGWHQLHVAFRQRTGSSSLTVSYQGPGFSKVTIPDTAFRGDDANATSQPLPAPPSAPTNLIATATSGSEISLSFTDTSLNETEFYLYKATGTNTTFIKVATLPTHTGTGTVNYVDSDLFSNVTYFYKLVAKNVGGNSAYSNEANAITLNSLPLLGNLENKIMRYGSVLEIGIAASDEDVEILMLSTTQPLPSFGQLVDYGDGTGLLTFTPAIADLGQYDITVRVDDQNGGFTTQSFNLTVDSNYFPEWTPIPDVSVDEASNIVVPIVATDLDNDPLTISAFNIPTFGQFTNNGNGTGSFSFNPLYGHFGTYLIPLTVTDSNGATTETTLKVTVNKVNVNFKVLVNFNSTAATNAPSPWNNLATIPAAGVQFDNLIDTDNNNTGISLQLVTNWGPQYGGYGDFGATTGNNSGVYPDNVLTSYYYTSDNVIKTIKYSGLNSALKYNFTFFGNRKDLSNRIAFYTINGQTVQLECADNTQNTVSINGISPDIDGSVTIDITKISSTIYGYLNAMEVTAFVDSGTPPIAPVLSSVTDNANGTVSAQWLDNSASEEGFRLYRSTSQAGPFSLVKTVGTNVSSTIDNGPLTSLQTYYYNVRAYNTYGETTSNTLSVTIPNRAPSFQATPPLVEVAENDFTFLNIIAVDPEGDDVIFSSSDLPVFVSLVDNGDNTAILILSPFTGDKGSYNVTLYAVDSHGNNATPVDLAIQVEEVLIKSIFVNFNDTRYPVGSPWNNFGAAPTLNRTLALRDQDNATTGITLTLLDAWQGANTLGTMTGSNTGVYPDDVMRTFYYDLSSATRRIRVSGLQPEMTYNFTFFGSRTGTGDKTTNYTIGANTQSLDANNNTSNTVSINGQKSNASGEIVIQVQKSPTSPYAYLNAMVIQSYLDNGIPLSPSQFVATAQSRTSIKLTWFDNASNENNFEVYRSLSSNGPFTLRGTSPANTASFMDNGLTANTAYFYQIRSVNAEGSSSFSETASATTLDYAIYVNFDDGRNGAAPFPWYTLNKVPVDNDVWNNLTNDSGNGTGINLTLVQNFSGSNPFGMNTGNNSGIYPDRVLESFYYNEVAVQTKIKLSGLAPSYSYNLVFFASRNGGGNRNTNYTVNGNTIILNAAYNISNTVQFTGILPDTNGEIFIDLESAPGSVYAYLNALTIQAYTAPSHSGGGARIAANEETLSKTVKAYPNPFTDDNKLYVEIESKESQDVQVSLLAPTGAQLYAKQESIHAANNVVELDFSGNPLKTGLYLVKVVMKGKTEIVRVVKK